MTEIGEAARRDGQQYENAIPAVAQREPFVHFAAQAVPFMEENVDTDIILPSRFLLLTDKVGLGRFAFYERRRQQNFVLDEPRYVGAHILIAGANFGCGSSREHAPWALADLGFRVIIAPSFGEIFASNCAKNGILTIELVNLTPLIEAAEARMPLLVDLINQVIVAGDVTIGFEIDADIREAFVNGWDEVELILGRYRRSIEAFEANQVRMQPWLWSNG